MKIDPKYLENSQSIIYFKGLNALRFFAALLVVIHHGEAIRKKNGLYNLEWLGFFRNGGNAVTFFFVLSGFLITYLLLKENHNTEQISVRNFYWKRVLRIWPLYFLLVVIGVIVLPFVFDVLEVDYQMPYSLGQSWYYFIFFLPGLVTFYFGHHFLEPLWSIGVEEVFYLIWAPLVKFFKRNMFFLLIGVIIVKMILWYLSNYVFDNELFTYLVGIHKFESMAVGGLGAYWVFNNELKKIPKWLLSKVFQCLVLVLLIVYLVFNSNIHHPVWKFFFSNGYFTYWIITLMFLFLILMVSVLPNSLINIETKTLKFLGEISYGIYMYHMLLIFAAIFLLKNNIQNQSVILGYLTYYSFIIAGVIVTSSLSKIYFEDVFLKLRSKVLQQG